MVLKSIELTGFKSFAKKTELLFDSPVTAIVGPNGSGKSNVVEAIRFVLGEQSIKSLRGKGGSDLIFKGSKILSPLSRARVAITFDNRQKLFQFQRTSDSKISVDFNEITISREVFADGGNEYAINGTSVRLKDVVELLASVNIGSSGHHIISQGEADRLLSANAKDRRGMIEDALGLRVYQFRLKESERRLEKTLQNMKEVGALRREIAPHIVFLKKQVEKIEKAKILREEVINLYHTYFFEEALYLSKEQEILHTSLSSIREELEILTQAIKKTEATQSAGFEYKPEWLQEIHRKEKELQQHREEITRNIGRIEGAIETTLQSLERLLKKPETKKVVIPFEVVHETISQVKGLMVTLRNTTDDSARIELIGQIEHIFDTFVSTHQSQAVTFDRTDDTEHLDAQQQELKATLTSLEQQRTEIELSLSQVRVEKDQYFKEKAQAEEEMRIRERDYYEQKRTYDALLAKQEMILFKQQELSLRRQKHEEEKQEALVLVGEEALRIPQTYVANEQWTRDTQENLRRQIERIKIKIEDIGGGGGSDVVTEYEEKVARDQFLAKELVDLENAIAELRGLIRELRETIDREFKTGVEKINKQFNEFFSLMFGGGGAFLSIVVEHKRPSKDDEEQEVPVDSGEEFQFERGIEINVSLPHKKVKELAMLSGGERSLTSIALLFAMSQVNPPPFLVLDETDAALDEANSRRYGDMIENLSKYSQLIVVTHNRETMSRAKVLYGVTIGADGGSKLLSIKFDDAVKIAK